MAHVEDEGEEEQCFLVEPLFYDEAKEMAWALAERERRRREEDEMARKVAENLRRDEAHQTVKKSIIEYNTKLERNVYTRFFLRDFSVFDINELSLIPPMRYTDSMYEDEFALEDSANILSVSVVSSDVSLPINVYGSVIVRDSIDYKCIYLFRRHRDDCQVINDEDKTLILTGPDRGLVLVDFIYLEIDLKIRDLKDDKEDQDKQFSKGLISIDGRVLSRERDVVVRSETLESWLSTMEVRVATVLNTVEVTFEIKLLMGHLDGNITVGIKGIKEPILIHDSEADGVVTWDESRVVKLRRRVMTICLQEMLAFHIVNEADGVKGERTLDFTPKRTGSDHCNILCGAGVFGFTVVWSLMDFRM
ncbi:hypothetical protein QYE76_016944 [Lolium multiflorum]|uniref:DUF6598 domain-containing protein n=1 Tax=Lolium multiflorum TaxID=4521 RepID=A0AAD8QFN5_LOLMU|nr:hypothetical protein QYE76_016944 [Lolium multiflorum]